MLDLLKMFFDDNLDAIKLQAPNATRLEPLSVNMALQDANDDEKDKQYRFVNFASGAVKEWNLAFSLGNLTFNNPSAPAGNAPLQLTFDAYWDQDGFGDLVFAIENIKVAGVGYDLYDFNYSSGEADEAFVEDAAAVQAGYGTLGTTAGHVFDTVVNLDNVSRWSFAYA